MPSIAFLGLGIMGSRMAARLLGAGFSLRVWNRSKGPAETLRAQGAFAAGTPAEAAQGANVVITMLGDPSSVKDVALGAGGVVETLHPNQVYVDMTTVDPATARGIDCACRRRGVAFVEAPVTGSKLAAAKGELVLMVGGPEEVVRSLDPVFSPLAKHVVYMGDVGCGSTMKLVNNLAIAGSILALFEALTLGRRAGLADERMIEVLSHSALASPLLALKARAVAERDFEPHFAFKHMAKDIRLVVAEAKGHGVRLALAELLDSLFAAGLERGYEDEDFAALIKVVEQAAAAEGLAVGDAGATRNTRAEL
ncbi:MAG: NAD(P)-dependent oxidoreductase [Nitrospirae bacterium]|nr:NAD(P)-dependent oxidoreductase [Nitrospirota bacterium]